MTKTDVNLLELIETELSDMGWDNDPEKRVWRTAENRVVDYSEFPFISFYCEEIYRGYLTTTEMRLFNQWIVIKNQSNIEEK